jgi:hypothetical protein
MKICQITKIWDCPLQIIMIQPPKHPPSTLYDEYWIFETGCLSRFNSHINTLARVLWICNWGFSHIKLTLFQNYKVLFHNDPSHVYIFTWMVETGIEIDWSWIPLHIEKTQKIYKFLLGNKNMKKSKIKWFNASPLQSSECCQITQGLGYSPCQIVIR